MKRTLICNIKIFGAVEKTVYESTDRYLPASDTAVRYPSTAAYEKILKSGDELFVIIVAKKAGLGTTEENILQYKEELAALSKQTGADITSEVLFSDYDESAATHNDLLLQMVSLLTPDSEVTLDMTFGSKDLPIVEFAALTFAERYLNCNIGEIMYGQAEFSDGKPVNTKIWEMGSLYYINSIISRVSCDDPEKAKHMLEVLLRV